MITERLELIAPDLETSMINTIFDLCVALLLWLGQTTGIAYKELNVWLFVIIHPIITLALIAIVIRQQIQLRRLARS